VYFFAVMAVIFVGQPLKCKTRTVRYCGGIAD